MVPLHRVDRRFLVLLFPDGNLPSPRWRWLVYVASGGMATAVVAMSLYPGVGEGVVAVENPIGIESAKGPLTAALVIGIGTLFASIAAAVVATVLRFRRAEREERQQLKWFATAAVITAAMYFSSSPAGFISHDLELVLQSVGVATWMLLPVAAGIAILKYRLYDIDVVISRSLVYGTLTLFVLGVYAGLVAIADTVSSRGGAVTSLLAAVVVAVAFAPVKDRLKSGVDRLLYGERRDPYRALSQLGIGCEAALTPEDVLPAIVGAVAQALRVPYVAVELIDEEGSHVAPRWERRRAARSACRSTIGRARRRADARTALGRSRVLTGRPEAARRPRPPGRRRRPRSRAHPCPATLARTNRHRPRGRTAASPA